MLLLQSVPGKFQSTPPRRRRRGVATGLIEELQISIHASAKEATIYQRFNNKVFYFNPRLREGGDGVTQMDFILRQRISIHASAKEATVIKGKEILEILFQSTPPRRRRQCKEMFKKYNYQFQSTPPRRRRPNITIVELIPI